MAAVLRISLSIFSFFFRSIRLFLRTVLARMCICVYIVVGEIWYLIHLAYALFSTERSEICTSRSMRTSSRIWCVVCGDLFCEMSISALYAHLAPLFLVTEPISWAGMCDLHTSTFQKICGFFILGNSILRLRKLWVRRIISDESRITTENSI